MKLARTQIGLLRGEGFPVEVHLSIDDEGQYIIDAVGDMDSDADGANGQNGARAAYMLNDEGSEFLANGGMRMHAGRIEFSTDWGKDIVFTDGDRPLVLPGGIIPSRTAYVRPAKEPNEPEWQRQMDSETVRYIAVPPLFLTGSPDHKIPPAVKGCYVEVENEAGLVATGMVGDVGPRTKFGEGSIAMLKALGLPSSPRRGGVDKPVLKYRVYPGKLYAPEYALQRMNGAYVGLGG